jgi:sugar/nucleoside kinase (ribokinase family)
MQSIAQTLAELIDHPFGTASTGIMPDGKITSATDRDVMIGRSAYVRVLLVGLCTVDVIQRVAELPRPGAKAQSESLELAAGGPAANAAVTMAALGDEAVLATALGAHPLAIVARDDLATHRVRVLDVSPEYQPPPPLSSVLVRTGDGERVVASPNAAGIPADPAALPLSSLLDGAGALLVDGHHPRLAIAAARAARAAGVPVVLDAGSDKPVLEELLPLVDVCACSAIFRLGNAGARGTEKAVHELGVPVVIRTDGAGPVRWSTRDGRSGSVRPPTVTVRDTLGAGDVWHGALTHGIGSLGRIPNAEELPGIIERANRVAARRVSVAGARAWLRDRR